MPASDVEKLSVAPDPLIDDAEVRERVGAVASSVVKEISDTAEIFSLASLTTT